MTNYSIYLSLLTGERIKIDSITSFILWAVKYEGCGYAMSLSADQSFLIAVAYSNLGKINSSDGSIMASYANSKSQYPYKTIHI